MRDRCLADYQPGKSGCRRFPPSSRQHKPARRTGHPRRKSLWLSLALPSNLSFLRELPLSLLCPLPCLALTSRIALSCSSSLSGAKVTKAPLCSDRKTLCADKPRHFRTFRLPRSPSPRDIRAGLRRRFDRKRRGDLSSVVRRSLFWIRRRFYMAKIHAGSLGNNPKIAVFSKFSLFIPENVCEAIRFEHPQSETARAIRFGDKETGHLLILQ